MHEQKNRTLHSNKLVHKKQRVNILKMKDNLNLSKLENNIFFYNFHFDVDKDTKIVPFYNTTVTFDIVDNIWSFVKSEPLFMNDGNIWMISNLDF